MLALSAPSCGQGGNGSFAVRVVGPPAADAGTCAALEQPAPPTFESSPPDLVRLTYRRPGGGPLVCDVVLPLDGPNRLVALPGAGGDPVDVYVELFRSDAAGAELRASGVARGVDPKSGRTVSVQVRPREAFSCAPYPATVARAFHSATTLPDGRVLLVGGLVADPEGTSGRVDLNADEPLFASNRVEIYDPESAEFRPVSVSGLSARAFHQALYLGEDDRGRYQVALYGGLTVPGDPHLVPAARLGDDSDPLRLMPASSAVPAPTELVAIDPETFAAERTEVADGPAARYFGAAGGAPRPVVAGGLEADGASADLSFEVVDPGTGAATATFPLRAARVGATATDLGGGRLLLYGGNLESEEAALTPEAAEIVSGLEEGDAPGSGLLSTSSASDPAVPRAFHAAVSPSEGQVLLAGGFELSGGAARAPEARFAQLLADGSPPTLSDVVVLGGVRSPAGYLAAAPLEGGGALVSGGNPALGHEGCPQDAAGLACAVGDAYRYQPDSGDLDPVGDLVIPRYGHRMTLLPDGTVLVTGGLGAGSGGFRVLADAEIFEPHTEADDPISDLDLMREPGDVARDEGGDPVAECKVVR